jgi:hypothetical protein
MPGAGASEVLDRQITMESGWCQEAPVVSGGASIDSTIRLITEESREPTRGLELLPAHYE